MASQQALDNSGREGIAPQGVPVAGSVRIAPASSDPALRPVPEIGALKNPGSTTPESSIHKPLAAHLSDLLPADTIKTMSEVPQRNYRIRAFVKEIGGEQKTLVLLGERHSKSAEAFKQGDTVVDCFNYRALEGFDTKKYWASKALMFVMEGFDAMYKILGRKDTQSGSTIDLVQGGANLDPLKHSLVEQVSKAIKTHQLTLNDRTGWKDIPAAEIQGQKIPMASIEGMELESCGVKVRGAEILEAAFKMATSADTHSVARQPTVRVFQLEEDHKPTLTEQLGMAYLPFIVASNVTFLACALLPTGPIVSSIKLASGAVVLAGFASAMCSKLLQSTFYDSSWLPYLQGGPLGALVTNRNKTFVNSINALFNDKAEVNPLLVIVGRGHVPGMSNSLVRDHGWKELSVPGQKEGY
jgi:hypothetical protein